MPTFLTLVAASALGTVAGIVLLAGLIDVAKRTTDE